MRKLSHKRALNQQSLDIFFKPKKEKELEIPKGVEKSAPKPVIQNCYVDHSQITEENTKYDPIITFSDFEFGFSTDEDESPDFTGNNISNNYGSDNNNNNKTEPDDDSDFEKESSSSSDSYYNHSQVSSPTIITRHQELEKKKAKIKIFTPTWFLTSSLEEPKEEYSHIKFDLNSMCNIHYQLEVIEKRIQNGDDEEHEHPAMCVQVLDEEGLSEVTNEEKKLRSSYEEIIYDKIKPSFWEPRCYDDEYYQLSRNDNRNLQTAICLADDADSEEIVNWEPEDEMIPPRISSIQKSNFQKKEEVIDENERPTINDSLKFVFVNSTQEKAPPLSFVYKQNSKKTLKQIEPKKNAKKEKELITSSPKSEKSTPKKENEKRTLFSYITKKIDEKPKNQDSPQKNATVSLFESSDSEDSSETDSETDTSQDSDLTNVNENTNDNILNNPNETSVKRKAPTAINQRLLRLSSLLFDTDSTDSETDFENF